MDRGEKSKRLRLSRACNLCRARKVRCDERLPSCHNCEVAGVQCVTVDPKRPDAEVPRKRVGSENTVRQVPTNGTAPSYNSAGLQQDQDIPPRNVDATQRLHELEREIQRIRADEDRNPRTPNTNDSAILDGAQFRHATRDSNTVNSRPPDTTAPLPAISSGTGRLQPLAATSPDEAHLALGSKKRKWMGSSSVQVLTQWLDLYSTIHGSGRPLSASFSFGMTHAEELMLPLAIEFPKLPSIEKRDVYINAYLTHLHPIFPILDAQDFWGHVNRLSWLNDNAAMTPGGAAAMLQAYDVPIIACIYAVISLGIDEDVGKSTELGKQYLNAAYSLLAHMTAMPYQSSVQGILLITLALRMRCKDGAGWNTLSLAIRIAYSLGLHRSRDSSSPQAFDLDSQLEARIWWAAFCLESIMAFESGRPCMISIDNCSQIVPGKIMAEKNEDIPDLFPMLIRLTLIQRKISVRLFGGSMGQKSQTEIILHTSELDRELLEWAESLPIDIRPGHDIFCDPTIHSFAVFLGLQYHQTLAMVHRASLLLDTEIFQSQVDRHLCNARWKQRIRAGETICLSAARHIVRLLGGRGSRRISGELTPPLLATYVLAIYLLKHPEGWSAKAT